MNIFFGLPPEGMTVFLGFGPDCSLFSQKELPQGSGRVWFVTSEALPLEICQASAFRRYMLPFNENLLPLSQTRTQIQGGGTTLGKFLLHRHAAVMSEQSQGCGMHWLHRARGTCLGGSCSAEPLHPIAHIQGGSEPQGQWAHLGPACLELVKQPSLQTTAQHSVSVTRLPVRLAWWLN